MPTAAPTPDTAGVITSDFSKKCLDVSGGSTVDGAQIVQSPCNSVNQDSLMWNFVPVDGDFYQIRSTHSGKCMAVESALTTSPASVVQLPCGTEPHKLWRLTGSDSERSLIAKHSGYCMDILGWSTAGSIDQCFCHSHSVSQKWDIQAAIPILTPAPTPPLPPGSTPAPTSLESDPGSIVTQGGKCIEIENESYMDGAKAIQSTCQGSGRLSQMWIWVPVDSEYYQIKASHSSKCLGVEDTNIYNLPDVVQVACGMEDKKLWKVTGSGSNRKIQVKSIDACMVGFGHVYTDGVKIEVNYCFQYGADNQNFEIDTLLSTL